MGMVTREILERLLLKSILKRSRASSKRSRYCSKSFPVDCPSHHLIHIISSVSCLGDDCEIITDEKVLNLLVFDRLIFFRSRPSALTLEITGHLHSS